MIGPEDVATSPFGFNKAGDRVYMLDSRARDTAALTDVDMDSLETTLVAEDPRADIDGALIHPTERTLQAYVTNYHRIEWHVLDDDVAKDFEYLRAFNDGDLMITSRTLDDSRWTICYVRDDGPCPAYLYDRPSGQAKFLFNNQETLRGLRLRKLHPVTIPSRDGLDLVSFCTLPHDAAPEDGMDTGKTVPLVLVVHGGPWWRDTWRFNPYHQWLANRGYAVLCVNYRGSTGYGKAFVNAADQEWAGKMHDDLIDAVNWAVETGITEPDRVAIMGESYGGFSTLVGLTFTPEFFACGVDIMGPSNLVTQLTNVPAYWAPWAPMWRRRVGDPTTEGGRAFLEQRSPVTYADRIVRPLLIAQGANDVRVTQQESDQIVQAMTEKGIPVTYLLYSDEGHGFVRPENRMSLFAVVEAFFAKHLGGECEPIGDDFEGSMIRCLAGADEVPGLGETLASKGADLS